MPKSKLQLIRSGGNTPDIVTAPGSYIQIGTFAMTSAEAKALRKSLDKAIRIAGSA